MTPNSILPGLVPLVLAAGPAARTLGSPQPIEPTPTASEKDLVK